MPWRDDLLLVELGEILRLSDGPVQTLTAVASAIGVHHELNRCCFAMLDAEMRHATVARGHRPGLAVIAAIEITPEDAVVLATGVVTYATAGRYTAIGVSSYALIPLMRERTCVAVLFCGTAEPRAWRPEELSIITDVAERTWSWVERERLVDERTRALERSLREKTILLKEIHHRVKNNLQVVSSLLSLQRERISDPVARKTLQDSQARVRSMALVHENLYRSKDLASVHFDQYVRELVAQLWESHGVRDRGIGATVDVQDVGLAIDQAIPCGLIVNELVTNALKHAFPEGRRGNVEIGLALASPTRCVLSVRDDGIGLPAGHGIETGHVKTFGLDLVITFVEQLEAKLEVQRHETGTEFIVSFEIEGPSPLRA